MNQRVARRKSWYPSYEPSHEGEIRKMLELAEVTHDDVVYDIGCGEGNILLGALSRGARTIGVDYSPLRIRREKQMIGDRGEIIYGDIFEDHFWSHKGNDNNHAVYNATVLTMFLNAGMNAHLRPLLEEELRAGTRVVSNYWPVIGWIPVGTAETYFNQNSFCTKFLSHFQIEMHENDSTLYQV